MKMYLNENVWDKAIERIEYIFDEFDEIIVSFSGGKDSTVIFNLALIVAKKKNRLPLKVLFVDQEAEWRNVIEYTRNVMSMPEVEPYWLQIPIKLFNATSMEKHWLNCWAEGEEWIRPKEEISIKENVYGTDRFKKLFVNFQKYHFPNRSLANFSGVRAEESPNRRSGLCNGQTYKHITYGSIDSKKLNHYTFYPLYDWNISDIWKAIYDNKWKYCKVYDEFYKYGLQPHKMRVSNLHHETAVDQLFYLHEIEPDTWNKLTTRLKGINQSKHMKKADMFGAVELPYMFNDWEEYRDHLLNNLILDSEIRKKFQKKFADMEVKYGEMNRKFELYKTQIISILANDFEFTKIDNFRGRPEAINYRRWKRGIPVNWNRPKRDLRFIKPECIPNND
jgi:predicted phosphoadenosine phosphosulfate sulfurtransferase